MKKITVLISFLVFSSIAIAASTNPLDKMKQAPKPPHCVKLTSGCSICSDGVMRGMKKEKLSMSNYMCASKGKKTTPANVKMPAVLAASGCVALSDFCGICADESFIFLKDGSKISADLYECATSPRVNRAKN